MEDPLAIGPALGENELNDEGMEMGADPTSTGLGHLVARYSKLIGAIVGVLVAKLFVEVPLEDWIGADLESELELAVIAVIAGGVTGAFPKNAD